ncbi:MAG TPA: PAS domain S-box protein [Pirellulales bacterium]
MNNQEFHRVLDNLPAAAYTCDPAGLITYFNSQAAKLWGREPKLNDPFDQFCGSFKLFAADGTPIAHNQCWMALALQTGQQYNRQEIIVQRPDGTRLNVLAHANPIRDEEDKIIGAINILVDISDPKHADEVTTLLAAIVECSEDAIISKTLTGKILTWNRGAEKIFGYQAVEAIGSPITIIIPPDRYDEEKMILSRLSRGERIEHYETVRMAKDGRRINISVTISPLRDSTGQIVGASKVARDVTARKQAETDLQLVHDMSMRLAATLDLKAILEDTLRTAAAIDGTSMGLLSLYFPDTKRLRIEASLGFDDEFLKSLANAPIGASVRGMCFQERRRVVAENIETDPAFVAFRNVARRGGFRAAHGTPLITRSGNIVGVLSTYFRQPHRPSERVIRLIDMCARQAADYIENVRLYHQLREDDRHKDEFLATLAHELRNPLAPLTNALNLMRLSDDLSPSVEQLRDIMEQQIIQLNRLVNDLLEISRIKRDKIELRKGPAELAAIVANAVETSRPLIEAAEHQLAVTLPQNPITLDADAVRLTQVIGNLLNNAAKYTEPHGQIWLTGQRLGSEIVISVRDTGIGISPDLIPRVFDMFAQADHLRRNQHGGLGIGLALSRRLIEMHGGRIEAHSDGAGKGSEFIIRLPLASVQPPAPVDRNHVRQLPSRRVLIVDDVPSALYVLGKLLERMGQKVRTAESAAVALQCVREERPDIIISDIGMPNSNGYDLARQLRQEPGMEGVILAALTGYGQDSDRQQAKEAGFDYHLVKPVSVEALEELLSAPAPSQSH